jgi:predicted DNA-binding protein
MLGVRLKPDEEAQLDRYAKAVGRSKSVLVREWIKERLERDSIDARMRRAATIISEHEQSHYRIDAQSATANFLRALDNLDGGYDWGPEGPPK